MFLKETRSGDLVDVIDMSSLTNPFNQQVTVQYQSGEDLADPVAIDKQQLAFPSGEQLPECWLNGYYRIKQ
ncbi:acetyltransferase [Photobacterium jeanii]|uniref:Acetyltransferase n=1 Tax=Photobacterium jeanii TaxID=858640 RepID=A0A178K1C7_9GAMM|nr:acetyltransferase [Photobacterium jeanii]OAN11081.1 acetyltransferase [Photobacterium jeanii]PST90595.1 acetyltransferase [Photobacterium jeanii]